MTGVELIRQLEKLSLKDLLKPVRYPTGEYLGSMAEVKSVTTDRPNAAEGVDSIYLLGYGGRKSGLDRRYKKIH